MSSATPDDRTTRVHPFFEALFTRDASGASWLPRLLAAAPYGRSRLGELAEAPGWLVTPLAVRGASGRLACFDYPVNPPRQLLRWFIDHPDRLRWTDADTVSAEAVRLRRALALDDPPGSRSRAQERARELLLARSALAPEWWRFEAPATLDCVLITGRLVVTIVGKRAEGLSPATPWYPPRTELVRALEAAGQMATGRRWGTLLLSDGPLPDATDEALAESLSRAAPHLGTEELAELREAYLGNLTWAGACAAVGLPLSSLPDPPEWPGSPT
jgi:hypothetical protein